MVRHVESLGKELHAEMFVKRERARKPCIEVVNSRPCKRIPLELRNASACARVEEAQRSARKPSVACYVGCVCGIAGSESASRAVAHEARDRVAALSR